MNHKVLETIKKFQMFAPGDTVTVGLSGGADSVSLLHILCSLRKKEGITVTACHINHNLRGEESLRDQQFVWQLCCKWEVPLKILQAQVKEEACKLHLSEEECGRMIRYRFFEENCPLNGKIATAHNLNDSLETVLFNLARGTGPAGLCGIQPVRGRIIRPLIDCTRAEIEAYCKQHQLSYMTDSTNLSDQYSRNRIRRQIVPQLKKINGGLEYNVRRLSVLIGQDEDYLSGCADRFLKKNGNEQGLPATALQKEHPAIASRVIKKMLQEQEIPYSQKRIDQLLETVCQGHPARVQLTKEWFWQVDNGFVKVEKKEQPVNYFEMPLKTGETVLQTGTVVHIKIVTYPVYENLKKVNRNMPRSCLDYDKIIGKVVARQRLDGDKIRLWNRKMTKSLKKLFNEAKLSLAERMNCLILADEKGIIWVEGFGCDERVAPDPSTRQVLLIECFEGKVSIQGRTSC